VYDIDDAEYLRTKTKSLHFFLKNCKVILVGSNKLHEYCIKYNPNVLIQTSPVISHNYRKQKKQNTLTIGWVGNTGNGDTLSHPFSHKSSLFKLFFCSITQIKTPIKLILIGIKSTSDILEIKSYFKHSPNIDIEILLNLNWKDDHWLYKDISQFDVGISPMLNHPFNQAKSAFKAKQYLSCGVPVIASNVGENSKFVINNYNGILCKDSEDFVSALNKFIFMKDEEYLEFSKNCLKDTDQYSVDNYCKNLIDNNRIDKINVYSNLNRNNLNY